MLIFESLYDLTESEIQIQVQILDDGANTVPFTLRVRPTSLRSI